jgi:hypothetical protein
LGREKYLTEATILPAGPGAGATRYERRLDAAGAGLAADFARAARAARRGVPAADAREAALRDVAAGVAAPMLAAYVLFVLEDAAAQGLGRVCFLARDGQVLHEIARRLAPRLHPGVEVRYLYASRQIWTRAISDSADHHWLWYGDRPGLTLRAVLRRLAVPGEAVAAPLEGLGLPATAWDRPLAAAELARLRPWLEGPEFAAAAAAPRAANRARLVAHLRQEGLLDGTPAAVVDLGWSGSLHDALSYLLAAEGAPPVEGYLFGIERVKDATWLERRHGYFFDHNRGIGADIFARVEDQRGFLEVFCAADHGTVTGLRQANGRIEAELDQAWAGPVAAWGLGTVRAAVAGFAEALALDRASREAALALRPVIGALLRDFWLAPEPEEARAWGAFPFNLGEGHGSYVAPLADAYGPADLARALKTGRLLKKHEHFWIEGALAASNPGLRRLLATARRLRRTRRG